MLQHEKIYNIIAKKDLPLPPLASNTKKREGKK
jgi:hypothetical protein